MKAIKTLEKTLKRPSPKWEIKSPEPKETKAIINATGVSGTIAAAMANRGITADGAKEYLDALDSSLPNPFLLANMKAGALRLADAIQNNEKVAIFGDFDADGVTSLSCLCWFARMVGTEFIQYIPDRISEGYGLNLEGIKSLHEKGVSLIISVDCGITGHEAAAYCKKLELDLVITDHHTPDDAIPDAYAVINPLLPGDQYPYKKLAGVGVAFNLAAATAAILKRREWFKDKQEVSVSELLPLVALGTIADVVEIQGVNRILVKKGLARINGGEHQYEGIRALCSVSGVNGTVTSGHVGFKLMPRVNAAGRMETAQASVDLFMCTDPDQAIAIAKTLDTLNTERQETEAQVVAEAIELYEAAHYLHDRKTIVLASPNWWPGVIGIASSRLTERYSRPTILISIDGDKAKGSCRSIKAFNIYNGLKACEDLLIGFGGHPMAAGLSIEASKIESFADAFEDYASEEINDDDLRPVVTIDVEADTQDLGLAICNELEQLEPFGMGNSKPIFCLTGCRLNSSRVLKEKHLKLSVSKNGRTFDAIGFNMAQTSLGETVDIAFTVGKNVWNDRESLQLELKGVRV